MKKKFNDAMMECYVLLYQNSTPPADFQSLMDNAELNEFGQKEIDFMAYEIEEETFNNIVSDIVKKYKFKNYQKRSFEVSITLGCSPKFKKIFNEK